MTNQATQYLALDVHQATVVASLRSADGSIRMQATVPTERTAVVNLVRGAGPHVHVALEEGTQAQWLHDVLVPVAERVVVCSTRGRSETAKKSDQLDADRLSELLRLGAVTPVFHATEDAATLRELVHDYLNLVDDATRTKLRIKALFRARGIRTAGRSVFSRNERFHWVEQLNSAGARVRANHLLSELDTITSLRRQAKMVMVVEARRRPGGKVLRSKRQLWPYCGLAVVTRSSGEKEFADGVLRRSCDAECATGDRDRSMRPFACAPVCTRPRVWKPADFGTYHKQQCGKAPFFTLLW